MNAKRSPTRRLLRYVVLGVLNLVVLLVVVALAVPLFFDPNDYKDEIAAQVKARTGRDLTISGDLAVTVLPWLGVKVGAMTLGNAEGFDDAPFARLGGAEVRVKLVPLLSREVEMDTVTVRGLELNLARNASGRGNWEDLAQAPQAGDGAATGEGRALAAFALGGVRLEDAALRYTDAASGEQITVSDLDLRTGPVALGAPVEAEVSLRFSHPEGSGKAAGRTRLTYDLSAGRYGAEELALEAEVTAKALGQGTASARVTGAVTYDDPARTVAARDLVVDLTTPAPPDSGLTGPLSARLTGAVTYDDAASTVIARDLAVDLKAPAPSGSGLTGPLALAVAGDVDLRLAERSVTSPALTLRANAVQYGDVTATARVQTGLAGTLADMRFALTGLHAEGEVSGGPVGTEPLPVALGGDAVLDLPAGTVAVDDLRLQAADFKAGGTLKVTDLNGTPQASGTLAAPAFALRKTLARAGVTLPPTKDPKALASAAVRTRFEAGPGRVRLTELRAELDETAIQGSVQARAGGALGFDLTVDRLDVDRYLPPEAPGAPPPAAAGALPVETLRALDLDGRLAVGRLRYGGLDLAKVSLGVKAKDGLLDLDPLQADLYAGRYQGDVRIDARGETPVIQVDERIANVDAAALLAALGVNTGVLDLSGGRSDLALKARLTSDAAGKRLLASGIVLDGKLAGRAFQGGPVPVSLRGDVAVDLEKRDAVLDKVQAAFAELRANASLRVSFAPATTAFAGDVSVPPFNARSLAKRLGVPVPRTRDPQAFTAVGAAAKVDGTLDRLVAEGMTVTLDGSTATGGVAIENLANPAFRFAVKVDRLDADRYLPPETKGAAATPGAAATALPVDLVRSLDLDGTLEVGALTVGGVKMSGVKVTAVAKGGQLKLSPVGAALYGGRYDGNVTVDARAQAPRVSLDETIQGVQIGPLLADVTGDVPVTGTTDLRAVLTATGGDTEALKRSLDGDVRFAIRDGALEKVDMVSSMCGTLAALDFDNLNKKTLAAGVVGLLLSTQQRGAQGSAVAGGDGTRTRFTEMSGSARLAQGVARNDDLIMVSPVVRARGAGTVSLPADQLDYRVEAELVESCAGIGKRDLSGHIIPVTIQGPIAKPSVSPQIPASLIQALRQRRSEQAPAAAPAATAPDAAAPAPPQPAQPQKPANAVKDARDELLKGILQGILKK